jgi:hypothetical protein
MLRVESGFEHPGFDALFVELEKTQMRLQMMSRVTEIAQSPIKLSRTQQELPRERVILPDADDERLVHDCLHNESICG